MKVTYPITLSHHGAYKQYNKLTLWLQSFIESNWDNISKHFQLPSDLEIRMRPRPCSRNLGVAMSHEKKVELNVAKQSKRGIIKTLLHELQHHNQYTVGDLVQVPSGKHWDHVWKGQNHGRAISPAHNHERYLNQPWEVEAREQADTILLKLEEEIGPICDEPIVA